MGPLAEFGVLKHKTIVFFHQFPVVGFKGAYWSIFLRGRFMFFLRGRLIGVFLRPSPPSLSFPNYVRVPRQSQPQPIFPFFLWGAQGLREAPKILKSKSPIVQVSVPSLVQLPFPL